MELVYKDPIPTEDEESHSDEEDKDKRDGKRHNNCLNRKKGPSSNKNTTVLLSNDNAAKPNRQYIDDLTRLFDSRHSDTFFRQGTETTRKKIPKKKNQKDGKASDNKGKNQKQKSSTAPKSFGGKEPLNGVLTVKRNIEDASSPDESSTMEESDLEKDREARANLRYPFFKKQERSKCPSGWFSLSKFIGNEDAIARYLFPKLQP
eukprot:12012939-Ditylum_brightwellii.AAC.1